MIGSSTCQIEGTYLISRQQYVCVCRLLPVIIEHTIDERSPLIGHTFDSLVAVSSLPAVPGLHPALAVCRAAILSIPSPIRSPRSCLLTYTRAVKIIADIKLLHQSMHGHLSSLRWWCRSMQSSS